MRFVVSVSLCNFGNRKFGFGMDKICYLLIMACILLASCKSQYAVQGTSSVEELEGQMLTLKVFTDNDMQSIDSARVVHGKFNFCGRMDSTMLANLFYGEISIMPLVLEQGNVELSINETYQEVSGTPLNDSLSDFIQRKAQLDARLAELPHMESQMVMEGREYNDILYELRQVSQKMMHENDRLVTTFIRENYNNALGLGIFMIMTSKTAYPVLTPQLEEIVTHATPYFLGHPYVREFLRVARENEEKLHEY